MAFVIKQFWKADCAQCTPFKLAISLNRKPSWLFLNMASGMKFETLLVNVIVKGYNILRKIYLMRQTTLCDAWYIVISSGIAITHKVVS